MSTEKRINTRELLRNFRQWKGMLVRGLVQHIVIDIGDDHSLELSVHKSSDSATEIVRRFAELPGPINVKRIDLTEELLPPRP